MKVLRWRGGADDLQVVARPELEKLFETGALETLGSSNTNPLRAAIFPLRSR
jgi:hypothetical protein